jgi:ADP-ribosylglycohydrolase
MRTYLRVNEIRPWLSAHDVDAAAVGIIRVLRPDGAAPWWAICEKWKRLGVRVEKVGSGGLLDQEFASSDEQIAERLNARQRLFREQDVNLVSVAESFEELVPGTPFKDMEGGFWNNWEDDKPSMLALPLRLSGAVWGHLVGDAIGVPYEFRRAEDVGEVRFGERGTYAQPPGTWSDDGALMLALLDSVLTADFDIDDQGRRALAWWRNGEYAPGGVVFDIGNTTRDALLAIEEGTPASKAGPSGERSQSNGALMRILPVALWGHERGLDLAAYAARASAVTHGHLTCRIISAAYVLFIDRLLARVDPHNALQGALGALRGRRDAIAPEIEPPAFTAALDALELWPDHNKPEGRGGALNAFWSAWDAFSGASGYRETIERAIRFGNDTDTTAAIAGGMAGTYWGLDGIPSEWLDGMRGREIVAPLVDRLIASHGWKTSVTHPIRVDWVDLSAVPGLGDAPGRLGMTFLPGKQYTGWHGDWWRDLDADVVRLREADGCDVFLLLVEDHELDDTRTARIPEAVERAGIELVRHAVKDMDIPAPGRRYGEVIREAADAIRAGRTVVVACRGGLGRTGTAVACLLVGAGMAPDDAIALTRATRHDTIERGSQVEFVRDWRP